jgi:hypothetical protein
LPPDRHAPGRRHRIRLERATTAVQQTRRRSHFCFNFSYAPATLAPRNSAPHGICPHRPFPARTAATRFVR